MFNNLLKYSFINKKIILTPYKVKQPHAAGLQQVYDTTSTGLQL